MYEWLAIGVVALAWELVGVWSHKRWVQRDPWGETSLTWLIVRLEKAHRWTRWFTGAFILWLAFHFLVQHWVS